MSCEVTRAEFRAILEQGHLAADESFDKLNLSGFSPELFRFMVIVTEVLGAKRADDILNSTMERLLTGYVWPTIPVVA